MHKKGLSDIITVVLLLLLTIGGVTLIWSFVQPVLFSQGQNIDLNQKCLEAGVEPESCSYCYDGRSQTPFVTTAIVNLPTASCGASNEVD